MSKEPAESLADKLINAFGGTVSKTAQALGHRHVTTVDGWRRTGNVPRWRFAEIRAAALKLNIELPPEFAEQQKSVAA